MQHRWRPSIRRPECSPCPTRADEAQDQEPATPRSVTSSDGGIFCPSLSHKFARRAEAVRLNHFGLSLSHVTTCSRSVSQLPGSMPSVRPVPNSSPVVVARSTQVNAKPITFDDAVNPAATIDRYNSMFCHLRTGGKPVTAHKFHSLAKVHHEHVIHLQRIHLLHYLHITQRPAQCSCNMAPSLHCSMPPVVIPLCTTSSETSTTSTFLHYVFRVKHYQYLCHYVLRLKYNQSE